MDDMYNRLRLVAEKHGTTLNHWRVLAGLSAGTLSDLKSGKTKDISRKTAERLAEALDITVEEIYSDDVVVTTVEDIQDELFEQRKILFDLSKKATKEDLEKFIKMMKAITEE